MRRIEIIILAAVLAILAILAVSCGHVSPKGKVREELRHDMEEYEDCAKVSMDALESVADAAEFADSTSGCGGCGGDACAMQSIACMASDLQDAEQADQRMKEIEAKWNAASDLTQDERAYIESVYQSCENKMMAKSMQLYARSQGGCGGCFSC